MLESFIDIFIYAWLTPLTEVASFLIVLSALFIALWYRARLETSEKFTLFLVCIVYLSVFLHYSLGYTENYLWRNIAARLCFGIVLFNLFYRVKRRPLKL